jgi:hypothetical protein
MGNGAGGQRTMPGTKEPTAIEAENRINEMRGLIARIAALLAASRQLLQRLSNNTHLRDRPRDK